jgi:hypothetical protein
MLIILERVFNIRKCYKEWKNMERYKVRKYDINNSK